MVAVIVIAIVLALVSGFSLLGVAGWSALAGIGCACLLMIIARCLQADWQHRELVAKLDAQRDTERLV